MMNFDFKKTFASDNFSSVSPEILKFLSEINKGHVKSYGSDEITSYTMDLIQKTFNLDYSVFFLGTGTAANVLSIKSHLRQHNSVICAASSHFNASETGSPEAISGSKLITIETTDGKLTPDMIEKAYKSQEGHFPHSSKPLMVTIAQSTEFGTLYSDDELQAIYEVCKKLKLYLHLDACRIYNSAVAQNKNLREVFKTIKPDVISLGGTKNGLMLGEAILIKNEDISNDFRFVQKQGMQLYSKMRYLSAQFIPFFEEELWRRNASNANEMTKLLALELESIKEVKITQKVETNHIFAILPKGVIDKLQKDYLFYVWNESTNEVRLVTSWDTTKEEILDFTAKLKLYISNL